MDPSFEWDEVKDAENQAKHGISFTQAQHAFADPLQIVAKDTGHTDVERRFFCFGRVGEVS